MTRVTDSLGEAGKSRLELGELPQIFHEVGKVCGFRARSVIPCLIDNRFVPPDDKLVEEEHFTYDMSVHGTDGKYLCFVASACCSLANTIGPVTVAYPTLRGGYDAIVQETLESAGFGFPRVLEPVCFNP